MNPGEHDMNQRRELRQQRQQAQEQRELRRQEAVLQIRRKFGNNAILKGMNLEEGGTTIDRNKQIGGHRA